MVLSMCIYHIVPGKHSYLRMCMQCICKGVITCKECVEACTPEKWGALISLLRPTWSQIATSYNHLLFLLLSIFISLNEQWLWILLLLPVVPKLCTRLKQLIHWMHKFKPRKKLKNTDKIHLPSHHHHSHTHHSPTALQSHPIIPSLLPLFSGLSTVHSFDHLHYVVWH